jgi:hypothetical protein
MMIIKEIIIVIRTRFGSISVGVDGASAQSAGRSPNPRTHLHLHDNNSNNYKKLAEESCSRPLI